ncbi:MAG: hypothetical protein KI792_08465 [Alphaproteobacteria bacterium]|nr:hypothetical protein [Alphaproteobacteria bacterium SS10]
MIHYVFDICGTLLDDEGFLDKDFADFFREWSEGQRVTILSEGANSRHIANVSLLGRHIEPMVGPDHLHRTMNSILAEPRLSRVNLFMNLERNVERYRPIAEQLWGHAQGHCVTPVASFEDTWQALQSTLRPSWDRAASRHQVRPFIYHNAA